MQGKNIKRKLCKNLTAKVIRNQKSKEQIQQESDTKEPNKKAKKKKKRLDFKKRLIKGT